jgi:hypothetical protein
MVATLDDVLAYLMQVNSLTAQRGGSEDLGMILPPDVTALLQRYKTEEGMWSGSPPSSCAIPQNDNVSGSHVKPLMSGEVELVASSLNNLVLEQRLLETLGESGGGNLNANVLGMGRAFTSSVLGGLQTIPEETKYDEEGTRRYSSQNAMNRESSATASASASAKEPRRDSCSSDLNDRKKDHDHEEEDDHDHDHADDNDNNNRNDSDSDNYHDDNEERPECNKGVGDQANGLYEHELVTSENEDQAE